MPSMMRPPMPPSMSPSGPMQPQLGQPFPFEDQSQMMPPPGPPVPGSDMAMGMPQMPMSEMPSGPPMTMEDLAMMGMPQDGLAMWGNPVTDAPTIDVDSMFPAETAPSMSLDPMAMMDPSMMGMGAPPAMDSQAVRMAAQQMLQQKAQARLGASSAFQDMSMGLAGTKY